MKVVNPNDAKITSLHEEASTFAKRAVVAAVQCGVLLLHRRGEIRDGDWEDYLETVQVPKETARRYMKVAEVYSSRDRQLMEGISLINLYRELGLIKALEGGGQRNGKQAKDAAQLYFNFNVFDGLLGVVIASKGNPFLGTDKKQLQETLTKLDTSRELLQAALKEAK